MKRIGIIILSAFVLAFGNLIPELSLETVHAAEANPADYYDNFEAYTLNSEAAECGWTPIVPSQTYVGDTFTTAVEKDKWNNQYLHVGASESSANATDRLYGISLDLAEAVSAADGDNITVEYDLMLDADSTGKSGEFYFGLAGSKTLKGAYLTVQDPKVADGTSWKTHWTGASGLTDDPSSYVTVVNGKTAATNLNAQQWNRYRWVMHTVKYGADSQYTADYAELYVNGEYMSTLPIRYGGAQLKYLNLGFSLAKPERMGFCVDNLKVYAEERTKAGALICDYIKDTIGMVTFSDLTVGTEYTNEDKIYNAGGIQGNKGAYIVVNKNNTKTYKVKVGGTNDNPYLVIGSNNQSTELQLEGLAATHAGLNEGEQYVLSFKYLPTGSMNLSTRFGGQTNTPMPLCSFNGASLTKIGTSSVNHSLGAAGEWHNIRIIITSGSRDSNATEKDTLKFYSDGTLLAEAAWDNLNADKPAPYTPDPLQRVDFIGNQASIDNIRLEVYKNGAVFVPVIPALMQKNSRSTGYANDKVYVGEKTVLQVLSDLKLEQDKNLDRYRVVDSEGVAVSGTAMAKENTLLLTTVDGNEFSIPLVGNTVIYSQSTAPDPKLDYLTITKDYPGAFGRDTTDTGWKITPAEIPDNESVHSMTLYPNVSAVPTVYKMSFLGKSNMGLTICGRVFYEPKSDSNYSGGHALVRLINGSVCINDASGATTTTAKQIGSYNDNEWVSIEIALFPGEQNYLVRINGEDWKTGTLGRSGTAWSFVMNGYIQLQIAKNNSHEVVLDDVVFSVGIPEESAGMPEVTQVSGVVTKTGKALYGPHGWDISSFTSDISVSDDAEVRFINLDGSVATEGAYNGGKMALRRNGIYSYYSLYSRPNAFTSVGKNDSGVVYWADLAMDATNRAPVIYNAIYSETESDGRKLTEVTSLPHTWVKDNVTITFTVPQDEKNDRRVMVWDKETMKPLTESFGMLPSTIYLVGDSICKTYSASQRPLTGWGEYIDDCFAAAGIAVSNRAEGGRSTKSFRTEGRWDGEYRDNDNQMKLGIMATLKANDYVFISLGHNDRASDTGRYTTLEEYKANLIQYINEARSVGARVILITPPTELWGKTNSLAERSDAMKEVAASENVTLLDLNAVTWQHFESIGLENAINEYYCTKEKFEASPNQHPEGTYDYTHFDDKGARYLAKTIAELLKDSGAFLASVVDPTAIVVD